MSEWGSVLGERFPDVQLRANSANSAKSIVLDANDTNDANGTEVKKPAHLPGKCAECGKSDDGTYSVVVLLAHPQMPWRHARCFSKWANENQTGREGMR